MDEARQSNGVTSRGLGELLAVAEQVGALLWGERVVGVGDGDGLAHIHTLLGAIPGLVLAVREVIESGRVIASLPEARSAYRPRCAREADPVE
jgi:hypothetical protein